MTGSLASTQSSFTTSAPAADHCAAATAACRVSTLIEDLRACRPETSINQDDAGQLVVDGQGVTVGWTRRHVDEVGALVDQPRRIPRQVWSRVPRTARRSL